MNQKLHSFIYTYRFSGAITFVAFATLLSLWFMSFGVFDSSTLPRGFTTRIELIGQVMMLIILPAYLAMGAIFGQRRSLQLATESRVGDGFQFAEQVVAVPLPFLAIVVVLGFSYSLLNLPHSALTGITTIESSLFAITILVKGSGK